MFFLLPQLRCWGLKHYSSRSTTHKPALDSVCAVMVDKHQMISRLDPVLDDLLMKFTTCEDLEFRLEQLFRLCDIDHGGSISREEFSSGLIKFHSIHLDEFDNGPESRFVALTPEDWSQITENELLCNSEGFLEFDAFRGLLLKNLRHFVQRKLANALRLLNNPLEVQANLLSHKYLLVSDILVSPFFHASHSALNNVHG